MGNMARSTYPVNLDYMAHSTMRKFSECVKYSVRITQEKVTNILIDLKISDAIVLFLLGGPCKSFE